jgi:hypothetical protein
VGFCYTALLPQTRTKLIQKHALRSAGRVFERLMAVAATTGVLTPDTRSIGIFFDDPAAVPEAELRAAACTTVPDSWAPSGELTEAHRRRTLREDLPRSPKPKRRKR